MKHVRFLLPILLSITILFFVSPALAKHKKHQPFFGPGTAGEWTEIDPEEVYPDFTYNDLKPACSNCPGTASDKFTFFAKDGQKNDLVIFFQGGGACWESMNCINVPTYTQEISGTSPEQEGIFDTTNPENPFKKWGFVFVPYCTGDLHWGANDMEYEDSWYQYGGGYHTIQHRGFVNFQVVLKWLQDNTKNPRRIFVTGSSAGSYGATMAFAYIKEAFPRSRLYLLGDAGNGITSPEFVENGIGNWEPQIPDWIFKDGYETWPTIAELYTSLSEAYPRVRMSQYTTAWDATQVGFYNVMLNIDNPYVWENPYWFVWCDWHQQMLDFAYDTADAAPNYRYYIAAGTDHTILRDPKFYTEEVDGVPFAKWVKAMAYKPFHVNRSWGKGRWRNVACEECDDVIADCSTAE